MGIGCVGIWLVVFRSVFVLKRFMFSSWLIGFESGGGLWRRVFSMVYWRRFGMFFLWWLSG